jgi:guanylate kinase
MCTADGVGKTSLVRCLKNDSGKRESKLVSKSDREERKGIRLEDDHKSAVAKQADFSPLLESLTDAGALLQYWEFSGTTYH